MPWLPKVNTYRHHTLRVFNGVICSSEITCSPTSHSLAALLKCPLLLFLQYHTPISASYSNILTRCPNNSAQTVGDNPLLGIKWYSRVDRKAPVPNAVENQPTRQFFNISSGNCLGSFSRPLCRSQTKTVEEDKVKKNVLYCLALGPANIVWEQLMLKALLESKQSFA